MVTIWESSHHGHMAKISIWKGSLSKPRLWACFQLLPCMHAFSACIGQAAMCVSGSLSTCIPPLYNGTPPSCSTLALDNPHIHVVPTLIFTHCSEERTGQGQVFALPFLLHQMMWLLAWCTLLHKIIGEASGERWWQKQMSEC